MSDHVHEIMLLEGIYKRAAKGAVDEMNNFIATFGSAFIAYEYPELRWQGRPSVHKTMAYLMKQESKR